MANLGYLDSDNYEDFAVGAPYDGQKREGAVFIYRGSRNFNFDGNEMTASSCIFYSTLKSVDQKIAKSLKAVLSHHPNWRHLFLVSSCLVLETIRSSLRCNSTDFPI